jgi:hypothetical protein
MEKWQEKLAESHKKAELNQRSCPEHALRCAFIGASKRQEMKVAGKHPMGRKLV